MAKFTISPDWVQWVQENKAKGCNLMQMLTLMVEGGNEIHASVDLLFGEVQEEYRPQSWFTGKTNQITLNDKTVDIIFQSTNPEIIIFSNFLSLEECDSLIGLSQKRLVSSEVIDATTGANVIHPDRTSNNSFYQLGETPLLQKIESRISHLLDIPVENGEGLQVLNYPPERQYKPHYDFFSSGNAESLHLKKGGQRIGTFIMYLNDVEAGGETTFPNLNVKISPKKGNALFFSYTNDLGQVDKRSLHAGNPVIQGNKWIATKWLRQAAMK